MPGLINLILHFYGDDRGARFKNSTMEDEQVQRHCVKGELAEVQHCCFLCCTGFAFKKCKAVDSKRFGELSHMRKLRLLYMF